MEPRPSSTSRLNLSNIIAACIVAAGLVSSARIIAGRPAPPASAASVPSAPASSSAYPLAVPPLSQATIQEQVRAQLRAAPDLQTYRYNKVVYRLSDATVSQVSYSAKDDTFLAMVNWAWLPEMPASGLRGTYVTLTNNGYNQYTGTAFMTPGYGRASQSANLCVK